MTVLESFLAFAAQLGEAEREAVEETLAAMMASYDSRHDFTAEETSELAARLSEPNPAMASEDAVRRTFGHTFGY